ncbi:hypothetical protein PAXRUDRAFT_798136, partial [Paxillus rubicundulus Ve08.2h10]
MGCLTVGQGGGGAVGIGWAEGKYFPWPMGEPRNGVVHSVLAGQGMAAMGYGAAQGGEHIGDGLAHGGWPRGDGWAKGWEAWGMGWPSGGGFIGDGVAHERW